MVTGINHITFAVRDLDKSLIFCRDVLGLSVVVTWAEGAYLQAGHTWIALNFDFNAPAEVPAGYSHIAFDVKEEDFRALAERICSCGVILWQEVKSSDTTFYFTDPDNHKLEIHVSDLRARLREMELDPPRDFILA